MHMLARIPPPCLTHGPAHDTFPIHGCTNDVSVFLSVFCLASIVTVIRLVNDAVDNIESEGMKEHVLFLLYVPLLTLLCLVSRSQNVCLAAEYKDTMC